MKVDALWLVVIVVALALIGWRLSALASRIDRLHQRIELARATLDAQLLRRSRAVEALATSGLVDPASAMVLAVAASNSRHSEGLDPVDRGIIESEMSRDLVEVFADPGAVEELRASPQGRELVEDLAAACTQVTLARRFLNDGVQAARLLRSGRMVRLFRLAGKAPQPATFEMDDAPPPALRSVS